MCFFGSFSSLNDEKKCNKYYNKEITTGGNGNVQSHDKEKSILSSTIIVGSRAHTLTAGKILKSAFNKNNVATIKNK